MPQTLLFSHQISIPSKKAPLDKMPKMCYMGKIKKSKGVTFISYPQTLYDALLKRPTRALRRASSAHCMGSGNDPTLCNLKIRIRASIPADYIKQKNLKQIPLIF